MKQHHPYDNFTVFSVFMALTFGSTSAGLAIMSAGEDTGDMLLTGSAAAVHLTYLLYVRHNLNRHQQKVVVA